MAKKKTLLLGLDAVCWSYLDPLLAGGELPHIQALMGRGIRGVLHSTWPPLTPAAWSSLITGKNPGKHGIFDMTYRRPDSYTFLPVSAPRRVGTPFWRRLNEAGIRVGLVNLPFTYPPDTVDGFVIAGFGAPGSVPDLTYPRGALSWLEERFGPYQPAVDPDLLRSGDPQTIFAAEKALQTYQVDAALALAEQYEIDVLAINLMMLDHANHKMPQMADVEDAIRQMDADAGRLIEGFQPDHVLAISDHGSRRVKGDFLLHAWLRDEGYCVQVERPSSQRDDARNWVVRQWLRDRFGWRGLGERVARRLLRSLVARLPAGLTDRFWRQVEQTVPFAREHIQYGEEIDFTRSRVYPGGSYSGLLYLNLVGREPTGVVLPEEAPALVAELQEKLMALTDPETGDPLFTAVHPADSVLQGPMTATGPHLIIDKYQCSWNVLSTFRRGTYAELMKHRYFVSNRHDFGHHSRDGIFIFAGPDFREGEIETPGQLMDVPATLLHLYNAPIPQDWDGRSLTETFTPEFRQQTSIRTQPGDRESGPLAETDYSAAETDEIMDHLRALGYVD